MYRLVMDHAQPGGQRGLVLGRLPLNPRRTTEHDDDGEADVKGKSKEVPEKGSDNPRNIIIPPSLDDEDPAEWLEEVSDSGLHDTPDVPYAGYGFDRSRVAIPSNTSMHTEEVPRTPGGARPQRKQRDGLVTFGDASAFVNRIMFEGQHSWEFRWMRDGDNPYRVGWSKIIPPASHPTSRERSPPSKKSSSRPDPPAMARTRNSGAQERGRPRLRTRAAKEPREIIRRSVSSSRSIYNVLD
jgi:hypothetical protein